MNPLTNKWYVVVNDLIGGYDISCWNKPASEHDHRIGEHEVAWGLSKALAEHIVKTHNLFLGEEPYSLKGNEPATRGLIGESGYVYWYCRGIAPFLEGHAPNCPYVDAQGTQG